MEENEKAFWRRKAIEKIKKESADNKRAAVVTGHLVFWAEDEEIGQFVYTPNDLATYTHILYLETPVKVLIRHHLNDAERRREAASATHLERWQNPEMTELDRLCKNHGIFFSVLPWDARLEGFCAKIDDFDCRVEDNFCQAKKKVDSIFNKKDGLDTVLLFDADRTLAPEDTGPLFWKTLSNSRNLDEDEDPLSLLFSSPHAEGLGQKQRLLRIPILPPQFPTYRRPRCRSNEILIYQNFYRLYPRLGFAS